MEFIGRLDDVSKDVLSGDFKITFTTSELPELPAKDKNLKVKATEYRQKRSLDANGYAWVLMSKIGDVLHTTKENVYVNMLIRYGQHAFLMRVEHGTKIDIDGIYTTFLEYDGAFDIYEVFRGSSTYDTKEMSYFIEGIVAEAKDLGIDTVPRVELEKIKEKWRL